MDCSRCVKMKIPLKLLLLCCATNAFAVEGLPRLELGASLFALNAPDYRGSRNDSSYLIPIPYIKYRGERLRIDEGTQGVMVDTENLLIALSGDVSLPVDNDTPERAGMAELDAIIEVGPSLNYRFYRYAQSAWWIDLPLRFAYTLNGDLDHIGYVFQPRFAWRKPARRLGDWKLRVNFGPLYASNAHHDYFYSVSPAEATPTRPVFSAEGGYSGLRSEFTWSRRYGEYWFGGFLRYDNLRHSEIEASPLVSETESWTTGIALGWIFHQR